jgi:hypothetical protein
VYEIVIICLVFSWIAFIFFLLFAKSCVNYQSKLFFSMVFCGLSFHFLLCISSWRSFHFNVVIFVSLIYLVWDSCFLFKNHFLLLTSYIWIHHSFFQSFSVVFFTYMTLWDQQSTSLYITFELLNKLWCFSYFYFFQDGIFVIFFIIHLFTCAYILWVISLSCIFLIFK